MSSGRKDAKTPQEPRPEESRSPSPSPWDDDGISSQSPDIWLAVKNGNLKIIKQLYANASGENCNEAGLSLLHVASLYGQAKAAKHLIKFGANTNSQAREESVDQPTPLHLAANYGHTSVGDLLLRNGAIVDSRTNKTHRTPFHIACKRGHLDFVKMLLLDGSKNADVWARASYEDSGFTGLHFAANNGRTDVAEFLADFNEDLLQAPDSNGDLPINVAAKYGKTDTVLALAKRTGLEVVGFAGRTPLHAAAITGQAETVRQLGKAGARLDARSSGDSGNTALIAAALAGHVHVLPMLVEELGAKLDDKDGNGNTVLHVVTRICQLDVLRYLLAMKIDVEMRGFNGRTALHVACEAGCLEPAKMLAKSNADLHAKSGHEDHESTCLHLACYYGKAKMVDFLMKSGASLDARDLNDNTPLHVGAIGGQVECIKALLARYPKRGFNEIDATGYNGRTALHWAAVKNHANVARLLLDNRANIEAKSGKPDDEMTPLLLAVLYGSDDVVKLLVRRNASKNAKMNADGALHVAAKAGKSEIAKYLVERGIPLEGKGFLERTPLLTAAAHGQFQTAQVYLKKDASVHAKSGIQDASRTVLHLAAVSGKKELVELLVRYKADVNAVDGNGDTPLHLAALAGNVECCHVLVQKGAKLDRAGFNGKTPLHHVVSFVEKSKLEKQCVIIEALLSRNAQIDAKSGSQDCEFTALAMSAHLGKAEIAKLLISKGASLEIRDSNGDVPIHIAARSGQVEICNMLLQANERCKEAKGKNGRTPLHTAVKAQQEDVVKLLLKNNVELNARSGKDRDLERVPLHFAAASGNYVISDLLVSSGASLEVRDTHNNTPFHLAVICGHVDIVALLVKQGADIEEPGKNGLRPLHMAAKANLPALVDFLLNLNAKIESRCGDNDDTVVHIAAGAGSLDVIKMLQMKNPEFVTVDRLRNRLDETPLHQAVAAGHLETVKFLVQKCGAKCDAVDNSKATPASKAHLLAEKAQAKNSKNKQTRREIALFVAQHCSNE